MLRKLAIAVAAIVYADFFVSYMIKHGYTELSVRGSVTIALAYIIYPVIYYLFKSTKRYMYIHYAIGMDGEAVQATCGLVIDRVMTKAELEREIAKRTNRHEREIAKRTNMHEREIGILSYVELSKKQFYHFLSHDE